MTHERPTHAAHSLHRWRLRCTFSLRTRRGAGGASASRAHALRACASVRERCADSGVARKPQPHRAAMCSRAGHTPYLFKECRLPRGAAAVGAALGTAAAPRRRRAALSPRYEATSPPSRAARAPCQECGAGGRIDRAPPLPPHPTSAAHGCALHRRAALRWPLLAVRARYESAATRRYAHASSGGGVLHTCRGTPPRRRHPAAANAGHGCGPTRRARRMRPAAPRRTASAARRPRARRRGALWRCCVAPAAWLWVKGAAAAIAPRRCRARTAAPSGPDVRHAALRCADLCLATRARHKSGAP